MKLPWHPFKELELKLEFGKGEAKAWKPHQTLCEFVEEIGWISYVFLLYVVGERILLDFFGFCAGNFPVLRTLLLEVSGVVPFVFVNRFLFFYKRTVMVRLG